MRVTMILPALTEATSPFFRPIKYSLFPPLGLATLAGYLRPDDEVRIWDEHVERLRLDDDRPDLAVIQPYITSARRAYQLADGYRARGVHVAMGGLHVTSLPREAAGHADTIFIGPGEDTWPVFLDDFRRGEPRSCYTSTDRSLAGLPPVRRDLIQRHRYLVPNSIVVSRGCPHHCDFCYKDAFFEGGRSFYTQRVDAALAEIDRLPGRHLYFLDDHLLGNRQNIGRDYGTVVRRLHDLGVMVNASFVFGMDGDRPDVFDRTVAWAVAQGIETATFHLMTPYPGTGLYRRIEAQQRILHHDWDRYDTRHVVYQPVGMTPRQLEDGYWRAYREFYRWSAIWRGAATHTLLRDRLRHLAYAGGWKKFEPLWDLLIRTGRVTHALPILESLLGSFGGRPSPTKESKPVEQLVRQ